LPFDHTESYLCVIILASYLQVENLNVLKLIINSNIEQTKLNFIV